MAITTPADIVTRAETIRNETAEGQNTATRVGSWMRDSWDTLQSQISGFVSNSSILTLLAGYIPNSQKGVNNGVAPLDANGKVLELNLPSYNLNKITQTNPISIQSLGNIAFSNNGILAGQSVSNSVGLVNIFGIPSLVFRIFGGSSGGGGGSTFTATLTAGPNNSSTVSLPRSSGVLALQSEITPLQNALNLKQNIADSYITASPIYFKRNSPIGFYFPGGESGVLAQIPLKNNLKTGNQFFGKFDCITTITSTQPDRFTANLQMSFGGTENYYIDLHILEFSANFPVTFIIEVLAETGINNVKITMNSNAIITEYLHTVTITNNNFIDLSINIDSDLETLDVYNFVFEMVAKAGSAPVQSVNGQTGAVNLTIPPPLVNVDDVTGKLKNEDGNFILSFLNNGIGCKLFDSDGFTIIDLQNSERKIKFRRPDNTIDDFITLFADPKIIFRNVIISQTDQGVSFTHKFTQTIFNIEEGGIGLGIENTEGKSIMFSERNEPLSNGVLFMESGALKFKGGNGSITTIAPA